MFRPALVLQKIVITVTVICLTARGIQDPDLSDYPLYPVASFEVTNNCSRERARKSSFGASIVAQYALDLATLLIRAFCCALT